MTYLVKRGTFWINGLEFTRYLAKCAKCGYESAPPRSAKQIKECPQCGREWPKEAPAISPAEEAL